MEETELENQNTFFKYEDKIWYDREFDFQISFRLDRPLLSHHCEVQGDIWPIKYLKNIEDLKRVYEAIKDEKFE
jgi:hypothetical protein